MADAGVGFMEAPVITYVGEISEPNLRGILTSYSGLFVMLGLIVELVLGTIYGWNTAALISSFVPIVTIVAISQVSHAPPFTPGTSLPTRTPSASHPPSRSRNAVFDARYNGVGNYKLLVYTRARVL